MGDNLVITQIIAQWLSLSLPRIGLDISQCVEGSKTIAICPTVWEDQRKTLGDN